MLPLPGPSKDAPGCLVPLNQSFPNSFPSSPHSVTGLVNERLSVFHSIRPSSPLLIFKYPLHAATLYSRHQLRTFSYTKIMYLVTCSRGWKRQEASESPARLVQNHISKLHSQSFWSQNRSQ